MSADTPAPLSAERRKEWREEADAILTAPVHTDEFAREMAGGVLALLDALDVAEKRVAELEALRLEREIAEEFEPEDI